MTKSITNDKPRKRKVKSGCVTCKIRKVKCDEQKPCCQRCLSTGRKCDGYGIWNQPVYTPGMFRRKQPASILYDMSPHILHCSSRDRQLMEWFHRRTVIKLPGTFYSPFWDKLLLQASMSERAIFHAVLALGAASKYGSFVRPRPGNTDSVTCGEEQCTTRHYIQSIQHLKTSFHTKDRHSVRVILIACIAFICLDFLRGHFEAGQSHLARGLQVLDQVYLVDEGQGTNDDVWILEIFARLDLMVSLFRNPSTMHLRSRQGSVTPYSSFCDLHDAWKELQRLLKEALDLNAICTPSPQAQQQTEADLSHWLRTYQDFTKQAAVSMHPEMKRYHHILYAYQLMALAMVRTALRPEREMSFDEHTDLFLQILQRMCKLRKLVPPHYENLDEDGLRSMHEYLSDIGWITPLYYTAIHCRHHRVRLHAVRLLESSFHREGIWDSVTTACVARKVVMMEERDFYAGLPAMDSFDMTAVPLASDLTLPTIPSEYRLSKLNVVLLGAPMDQVQLFSELQEGGSYRKTLLSTYCMHTRSWTV